MGGYCKGKNGLGLESLQRELIDNRGAFSFVDCGCLIELCYIVVLQHCYCSSAMKMQCYAVPCHAISTDPPRYAMQAKSRCCVAGLLDLDASALWNRGLWDIDAEDAVSQ